MAETKKTHQGHHDAGAEADLHAHAAAGQTQHVEAHHPSPMTYVRVAMTLTTITALEVGVFYIHALGKGIIPVLITLSSIKFALVIMFYMHLRYDTRLFSFLFVGGLALAISVFLAVVSTFVL